MANKYRNLINIRRKEYLTWKPIYVSLLSKDVAFNMRGFKHLRFHTNNSARKPIEIIHKLRLLPFVPYVLRNATEIEDYRKIGAAEYWSFVAIPKGSIQAIRVIIRRVGKGEFHFWSVMGLRT